ncbi:MAG: DHA2 family efflux MFS transporter permease subunit, partial [Caldilineaceae bacterium]|nr:DHA2 family efflux MFS transporter permease subunit [Caldilineaceae bacterium]
MSPPAMAKPTVQPSIERKWHIFAALGSGIFLASFDGGVVRVALPTLVTEFNVDFALVQWVVLSFSLTQTAIMLGVGRLGDMVGKKPIFLSGTIAFAISSVLAGLAPNIELLLFFRVLQAIGGAFATALSMGIVTETFPASERGKALGLFSATVSVGGIAGPILGGALLEYFSWRWIFFVSPPVGCVSFLLALRYLPGANPGGRQRFDWVGFSTFFAFLLALMLFLTVGQRTGFRSPAMLGLLAFSLLSLTLFIRTELRVAEPLLDLTLFRNTLFSLNLSMRLISFIVTGGITLLFPFYLSNLLQLDPSVIGLLLTATMVFFGLASPISGILSDRFGYRLIATAGLVMFAFGCYTVSTLTAETSIIGYVLRVSPLGLGMGIFQSPNNSAVMGSVPRERLGVVSGVNVIGRTLGNTAGVAALGALWASRVLVYAGPDFAGDVTEAVAVAQTSALR